MSSVASHIVKFSAANEKTTAERFGGLFFLGYFLGQKQIQIVRPMLWRFSVTVLISTIWIILTKYKRWQTSKCLHSPEFKSTWWNSTWTTVFIRRIFLQNFVKNGCNSCKHFFARQWWSFLLQSDALDLAEIS